MKLINKVDMNFKLSFAKILIASLTVILLLLTAVIWLYFYRQEPDFSFKLTPINTYWREDGHIEPYIPNNGGIAKVWPHESALPILHDGLANLQNIDLKSDLPLSGLTVVVDAGHGGTDPGTVWPPNNDFTFAEKDVTLKIAAKLNKKLTDLGAKIIVLRENDDFISIYNRTARVGKLILQDYLSTAASSTKSTDDSTAKSTNNSDNQSSLTSAQRKSLQKMIGMLDEIIVNNSDKFGGFLGGIGASEQAKILMDIEKQYSDMVFLSIHVNSAGRPEPEGTQVYLLRSQDLYEAQNIPVFAGSQFNLTYQGPSTAVPFYPLYVNYHDRARERLARSVLHSIYENIPQLAVKEAKPLLDENFAVLRTCNIPGVLIETGFITNENNRNYLWSSKAPDEISAAICEALKTYVNLMQRFEK